MTEIVNYALSNGVAHISMDDGKANIMSLTMLAALDAAFDRAADEGAAVVVLSSGRETVFSAGFDLKIFAGDEVDASLAMVRAGAELALRLMQFPRPIIGVVRGHAFPMGAFLLLACDIRLGAAGAYRMGLNEVAIGISPPGFAIELARSRIHPAWLSRTVTLGEMFEPDAALAAGFIDQIVPEAALEGAVETLASKLSKLSLESHALAKKRLRARTAAAMRSAIDEELTPEAYRARPPSTVVLPRGA